MLKWWFLQLVNSCRERLIQMLALRPFKKIELHDRLTKGLFQISTIRLETSSLFLWHFKLSTWFLVKFPEGLRGTSSMTTVLKQIAQLRDNCYYLNRNMWNEVNEDWPFYTETEKQILKRFSSISSLLIQYNQFFCEGANRKIWLRLAAAMVAREADNRPPAPIPDLRPWSRPLIMWTGGRNVRATTKTRTVFLTRGRG